MKNSIRKIIDFGIKDGIFNPEDMITTEQFVAIIIGSSKGTIEPTRSSWSSGYMDYALYRGIIEDYDITNTSKPIERRSAARIVHETLLTEFGERDEDKWSAAESLRDLFSCHTCVMHIAQVYVKGIMPGRENNLFDALGSITCREAGEIVVRMLDREQRILQAVGREFKTVNLSPDEAWKLISNDSTAMLIDVRTNEAYMTGHIKGSVCISLNNISKNPFSVCESKDTPLILYCQKGYKSSIAAQILGDAGYRKVYTIPGIEHYQYNFIR